MSNPYQSPEAPSSSTLPDFSGGNTREFLREVARRQRLVLLAVGLNIIFNVLAMALNTGENPLLAIGVAVVALGIVAFSMFAMFQLANRVYGMAAAIVCSLLMLVPCISLITLLVVNQRATSLLQAARIKVGLFGADPATI